MAALGFGDSFIDAAESKARTETGKLLAAE